MFLRTVVVTGFMAALLTQTAWSQVISSDEINQIVAEELHSFFVRQRADLRVEGVGYRYVLDLPDGKVDWVVEPVSAQKVSGQQSVGVSVLVNGVLEKKIRVPVKLKMELKIPVARNVLQRGQTVNSNDLEWQTVAMVRTVPDLVRNENDILGFATTRRINAGEPLRTQWFEKPLAVGRGERVRVVVASKPGLKIETTAVAMDGGKVGDVIQLRNPESQMRYEARILSPGTVQVGSW
ncbi:MAG: Flagellar basal body P-ring biosynthesis protein-like protein [Magnetococcales bacterium]|nr:Flagellar basal body P-ring biosynthesis protein-like protein [Magnetococcales bacterium]HIJ83500.1 flagellar basal body P-ring formation protein FlgA [Magnetococcales bacterium]